MSDEKPNLPALDTGSGLLAEIPPDSHQIVQGDQLIGYYTEILHDIKEDRDEVSKILDNFNDMLVNQGDATHSTKEALVNLVKIKSEIADKKTRVLDLLLRSFNRDRSIPGYIAKNMQVNIDNSSKRNLLTRLDEEETAAHK